MMNWKLKNPEIPVSAHGTRNNMDFKEIGGGFMVTVAYVEQKTGGQTLSTV